MSDGNFGITDFDAVRAILDKVMAGELPGGGSAVDDMCADLSDYGRGFLMGYLNGYRECMEHVSLADNES